MKKSSLFITRQFRDSSLSQRVFNSKYKFGNSTLFDVLRCEFCSTRSMNVKEYSEETSSKIPEKKFFPDSPNIVCLRYTYHKKILGLADSNKIYDGQFAASSYRVFGTNGGAFRPDNGRLNKIDDGCYDSCGAWCALDGSNGPHWLQIDLKEDFIIKKIETQGKKCYTLNHSKI